VQPPKRLQGPSSQHFILFIGPVCEASDNLFSVHLCLYLFGVIDELGGVLDEFVVRGGNATIPSGELDEYRQEQSQD
jgi:hypothetical protein